MMMMPDEQIPEKDREAGPTVQVQTSPIKLKPLLTEGQQKFLDAWTRVMVHMDTPDKKMLPQTKISLVQDCVLMSMSIQSGLKVPVDVFQVPGLPQEMIDGCASMIVALTSQVLTGNQPR